MEECSICKKSRQCYGTMQTTGAFLAYLLAHLMAIHFRRISGDGGLAFHKGKDAVKPRRALAVKTNK